MESFSRKPGPSKAGWTALTPPAGMSLIVVVAIMVVAIMVAMMLATPESLEALVLPAQAQSGASQSAPVEAQKPAQSQDIPDAPSTVQPPEPERLDKPPVNPPPPPAGDKTPGAARKPDNFGQTGTDTQPPPPMPPIETLPPSRTPTAPRNQVNPQEDMPKIFVSVNFVQIPVTVKDKQGRPVDGLRPKDFTVLENGKPQSLTWFSTDPFELAVAIVLDQGMPDVALQKINQTFPALVAAFSVYDEAAIYTYSSTVSQV